MIKILLVPVIMICALAGTVGLIKIIEKFTHGVVLPLFRGEKKPGNEEENKND